MVTSWSEWELQLTARTWRYGIGASGFGQHAALAFAEELGAPPSHGSRVPSSRTYGMVQLGPKSADINTISQVVK